MTMIEKIKVPGRRKRKDALDKFLGVLFLFLVAYALLSILMQAQNIPPTLPHSMISPSSRQQQLRQQQLRQHQRGNNVNQGLVGGSILVHQSMTTERQLYYPGKKILSSSQFNDTRPPLDTLIQGNEIVGDVQFLLDFAIVGFGKCGTSTLMQFLAAHPTVGMFSREVYDLVRQQPAHLVQSLYQGLPTGKDYKRGYKNPLEISQRHVLEYYRTYWPRTKLLIGVRHPIRWFESLYNFRVQNLLPNQTMPHPNHLVGRCYPDRMNTCTEKGNFAYALMHLGKTNENTSRPMTRLAQDIVGYYKRLWYNISTVPYLPNPVFLYHLEQMHQTPQALTRDVATFLNLPGPIPRLPHQKPGLAIVDQDVQQTKQRQKIDICHAEYGPVRAELLRIGSLNARWIQEEFLFSSTSIHVSDPAGFRNLLHQWSEDPCGSTVEQEVSWNTHRLLPLPKDDPIIRGKVPFRVIVGEGK